MEISDKEALQIHGIVVSESDSDFDSMRDFDDDYYSAKPPPYDYEAIKNKIVVISREDCLNSGQAFEIVSDVTLVAEKKKKRGKRWSKRKVQNKENIAFLTDQAPKISKSSVPQLQTNNVKVNPQSQAGKIPLSVSSGKSASVPNLSIKKSGNPASSVLTSKSASGVNPMKKKVKINPQSQMVAQNSNVVKSVKIQKKQAKPSSNKNGSLPNLTNKNLTNYSHNQVSNIPSIETVNASKKKKKPKNNPQSQVVNISSNNSASAPKPTKKKSKKNPPNYTSNILPNPSKTTQKKQEPQTTSISKESLRVTYTFEALRNIEENLSLLANHWHSGCNETTIQQQLDWQRKNEIDMFESWKKSLKLKGGTSHQGDKMVGKPLKTQENTPSLTVNHKTNKKVKKNQSSLENHGNDQGEGESAKNNVVSKTGNTKTKNAPKSETLNTKKIEKNDASSVTEAIPKKVKSKKKSKQSKPQQATEISKGNSSEIQRKNQIVNESAKMTDNEQNYRSKSVDKVRLDYTRVLPDWYNIEENITENEKTVKSEVPKQLQIDPLDLVCQDNTRHLAKTTEDLTDREPLKKQISNDVLDPTSHIVFQDRPISHECQIIENRQNLNIMDGLKPPQIRTVGCDSTTKLAETIEEVTSKTFEELREQRHSNGNITNILPSDEKTTDTKDFDESFQDFTRIFNDAAGCDLITKSTSPQYKQIYWLLREGTRGQTYDKYDTEKTLPKSTLQSNKSLWRDLEVPKNEAIETSFSNSDKIFGNRNDEMSTIYFKNSDFAGNSVINRTPSFSYLDAISGSKDQIITKDVLGLNSVGKITESYANYEEKVTYRMDNIYGVNNMYNRNVAREILWKNHSRSHSNDLVRNYMTKQTFGESCWGEPKNESLRSRIAGYGLTGRSLDDDHYGSAGADVYPMGGYTTFFLRLFQVTVILYLACLAIKAVKYVAAFMFGFVFLIFAVSCVFICWKR